MGFEVLIDTRTLEYNVHVFMKVNSQILVYIPKLGFKTHSDPTPLKMRNKLSKVAKMVNSSLNAFLIFF